MKLGSVCRTDRAKSNGPILSMLRVRNAAMQHAVRQYSKHAKRVSKVVTILNPRKASRYRNTVVTRAKRGIMKSSRSSMSLTLYR